jgi:hypothetical protein
VPHRGRSAVPQRLANVGMGTNDIGSTTCRKATTQKQSQGEAWGDEAGCIWIWGCAFILCDEIQVCEPRCPKNGLQKGVHFEIKWDKIKKTMMVPYWDVVGKVQWSCRPTPMMVPMVRANICMGSVGEPVAVVVSVDIVVDGGGTFWYCIYERKGKKRERKEETQKELCGVHGIRHGMQLRSAAGKPCSNLIAPNTTQVSAHLCEYLQATCYESYRSAWVVLALTPRPEHGGAVGATTNVRTAR